MAKNSHAGLRSELLQKKEELTVRLKRITASLQRGYEADSEERSKQLEDSEVVDALGNEAWAELKIISASVARLVSCEFGICIDCGMPIDEGRIKAYPYALKCINCATMDEHR